MPNGQDQSPFNYRRAIELTQPSPVATDIPLCETCLIVLQSNRRQLAPPQKASWRVNAKGDILWGNVDRRIIGVDWASRRLPWLHVHAADRRRVQREWSAAITARASFQTHFRILRVTGEVVDVILRGEPMTCCGGSFTGFVGTVLPI
jgi:PAS domain-containing protein